MKRSFRQVTCVPVIRVVTADRVDTKATVSSACVLNPTRAHSVNTVREPSHRCLMFYANTNIRYLNLFSDNSTSRK